MKSLAFRVAYGLTTVAFITCLSRAVGWSQVTNRNVLSPSWSADAPYLALSPPVDCLQAGLFVLSSNQVITIESGRVVTEVYFALVNTCASEVRFFQPRDLQECFEWSMTDPQGRPVEKTRQGRRYGAPLGRIPTNTPAVSAGRFGLEPMFLPAGAEHVFAFRDSENPRRNFDFQVDLPRCFELKSEGNYKLRVAQRLYIVDKDKSTPVLKPLVLEAVQVAVVVRKRISAR